MLSRETFGNRHILEVGPPHAKSFDVERYHGSTCQSDDIRICAPFAGPLELSFLAGVERIGSDTESKD